MEPSEPTVLDKKILKKAKVDADSWTRCMFYLPAKKRHCNLPRLGAGLYCGAHVHCGPEAPARARIPCPVDPRHTIFENDVKKHVTICNRAVDEEKRLQLVYVVPGINVRTASLDDVALMQTAFGTLTPSLVVALSGVETGPYFQRLLDIGLPLEPPLSVLSDSPIGIPLLTAARAMRSDPPKHTRQQISILANMDRRGLLRPSDCYLEMGCGRGMLSLAIATVCASLPPPPPVCDPTPAAAAGRPLRFVLVDRSSVRRKADGELREAGVPHTRVKSDIADVSLVKVVELHEGPSVMVSKHLCGGATDLALSALASVCSKDSPVNVWGVAIATCCHHKCSWDVYTGKEWFTAQGLTAADFVRMTLLSSWATCGWEKSSNRVKDVAVDCPESTGVTATDSDGMAVLPMASEGTVPAEDHELDDHEGSTIDASSVPVSELAHLSIEARTRIGRVCKWIIDSGRVAFLRSVGYDTDPVLQYCDLKDSLESGLLLGAKSS